VREVMVRENDCFFIVYCALNSVVSGMDISMSIRQLKSELRVSEVVV
jgi:hypothetical protein